jgi:hypothetical protein
VTNEAIDVFCVREIEAFINPPVAGVTGGTCRPVALYADTKIVDEVLFPHTDGLVAPGKKDRFTFPLEVRRVEHLVSGIRVASQTFAGYGVSVFERTFDQVGVVGVG